MWPSNECYKKAQKIAQWVRRRGLKFQQKTIPAPELGTQYRRVLVRAITREQFWTERDERSRMLAEKAEKEERS